MLTTKPSLACEIYLALKLDDAPLIRQLAASIITQRVMEFHRFGVYWDKQPFKDFCKMRARFKLIDYVEALKVHYPFRYI